MQKCCFKTANRREATEFKHKGSEDLPTSVCFQRRGKPGRPGAFIELPRVQATSTNFPFLFLLGHHLSFLFFHNNQKPSSQEEVRRHECICVCVCVCVRSDWGHSQRFLYGDSRGRWETQSSGQGRK